MEYKFLKIKVRRVERTLTQKYNMPSLRALQHLEVELNAKLAIVYNCEAVIILLINEIYIFDIHIFEQDDVPVEIDLLHIFQEEASTRREILVCSRIRFYIRKQIAVIICRIIC